jgi:hopene-associated glycosyltransferase HpnB
VIWISLAAFGLFLWGGLLLAPWQAWRTRERLDAEPGSGEADLGDVTALIPARDEAEVIGDTLGALKRQGHDLNIIVIDDHSDDGTGAVARAVGGERLKVISAKPLPAGWSGKLWALEQGLAHAETRYILLIDADIVLKPAMLSRLRAFARERDLALVSLMAELRMASFWERLLMPAFIYFFKLIYPFRLSNSRFPYVAAAAGGCVLVERRALRKIGGFAALRAAIIDDCTLAARIKAAGFRTWIGLTHSVVSLRRYERLDGVWDMVARSAYAQLRYSPGLLLLCTVLMLAAFWLPVASLAFPIPLARWLGIAALVAMAASYAPTLYFYRRSLLWVFTLPFIGAFYLVMTWSSARRHWSGAGARWKGRAYGG